ARAGGCPPAPAGHDLDPPLQGRGAAGAGPRRRLRVPGPGLRLAVRRRQGHHRLSLQRLFVLPGLAEPRSEAMNHPQRPTTLSLIRCAIYTRKSTEEGLEQEFNSLDAQREAGQAYIQSQQQEGWFCLPDRYDDGGFTGGNTDRPALQRLLADIA